MLNSKYSESQIITTMKHKSLALLSSAALLLASNYAQANCTEEKALQLLDNTSYFNAQDRFTDVKVRVLAGTFYLPRNNMNVQSSGKSLTFTCEDNSACISVVRPTTGGFERQVSFYLNDVSSNESAACIAAYVKTKLFTESELLKKSGSIYDQLMQTNPTSAEKRSKDFNSKLQAEYQSQLAGAKQETINTTQIVKNANQAPVATPQKPALQKAEEDLVLDRLDELYEALKKQEFVHVNAEKIVVLQSKIQQANSSLLNKFSKALNSNSNSDFERYYNAARIDADQAIELSAQALALTKQTYAEIQQKDLFAMEENWKEITKLSKTLRTYCDDSLESFASPAIAGKADKTQVKMIMRVHVGRIKVSQEIQRQIVERLSKA